MGKQAKLKQLKRLTVQELAQSRLAKLEKIITIICYSLIILSIGFLAFTILKPGLPSGHDINAHAIRTRLFIDNLNQGQFPIRWTEWIRNGFSQPLFNFFPVGFYYLTALVHLVVGSITQSIKLTVLLLWWLGSLFTFLLLKRFGNLAAALGSLIFTFTPYLMVDVFVRASYPELAATCFAVGVLWALDRLLLTGKLLYALPLAICLAVVLISHLPTAVIVVPVFLAYAIFLLLTEKFKFKNIFPAVISTILGAGLGAFYLFPSLLELNLIKNSQLTADYYDFHSHFVYPQQLFSTFWGYGISQAGPNDGMPFQFGIIQWSVIMLAITFIIINRILKRKSRQISYLFFWLAIILYSIFFMHDISLSFWENLSFLLFIQYPWRFLMVIPVSSAFLSCLLFCQLKNSRHKLIITFIVITGIFLLYSPYLKPAVFLPNNYFNLDSAHWKESTGSQQTYYEQGYLPASVDLLPEDNLPKWQTIRNQAKITPSIIEDYQFTATSQTDNTFIFQLNSHYFLGWQAFLDHQPVQLTEDRYRFMQINVPSGIHLLEFKFSDTPIRTIANKISILSLIIMLLWLIWSLKNDLRLFINKTFGGS